MTKSFLIAITAKTKEITVHYILQPHHVYICAEVFILVLVPGGLQLLIISTCFVWYPVTSINESHALIARARKNSYIFIHGFLFINIWLLISCGTGIYAIMRIVA